MEEKVDKKCFPLILSIVVGTLSIILGLIADMLKMQRLLQEEILYRLKKMEIEDMFEHPTETKAEVHK